ncbi:unnamed protein product [Closterium sp. Naga37s-1]|nr:unnamed protein product [Closterium sp. Naga37s-1]
MAVERRVTDVNAVRRGAQHALPHRAQARHPLPRPAPRCADGLLLSQTAGNVREQGAGAGSRKGSVILVRVAAVSLKQRGARGVGGYTGQKSQRGHARRGHARRGGSTRPRGVLACARQRGEAERRGGEARRSGEAERRGGEARRRGEAERRGGEARRRGEAERRGGEARRRGEAERRGGEARRRGEADEAGTRLTSQRGATTAAGQACGVETPARAALAVAGAPWVLARRSPRSAHCRARFHKGSSVTLPHLKPMFFRLSTPFRLSTSLRLSAAFRLAAPVAHMLLRAPLHRSRSALIPSLSPSSPAASHGPVARCSQRSLATTATGHSAAASSRRRAAACALRTARATCPLYDCGLAPLPAPDATASLAPLALSPRRVARTLSAAGTGGEGVVRGNGGAREGSAAMLASGAWGESHKGQRGFGGGALPRATTAEGAVLRGEEAGGASGMGTVRGMGAPGATGARGGADEPARQGVVAQARWGGVEGAAAGGRAVVLWDLDNVQPERMEPFDAATRLTDLAASFGSPVDVLAYANRHAFDHVPAWVREQRRERREAERMAARGESEEREVRCELCGRRCSGAAALRKHFVSLHQREHEKRMQHLNHASPKCALAHSLPSTPRAHTCAHLVSLAHVRPNSLIAFPPPSAPLRSPRPHRATALSCPLPLAPSHPCHYLTSVLLPAPPMPCVQAEAAAEGGVSGQAAAAADEALKRDLAAAVRSGQVGAVLLVSDDRGYSRALGAAAAAGLTTVAVGINGSLQPSSPSLPPCPTTPHPLYHCSLLLSVRCLAASPAAPPHTILHRTLAPLLRLPRIPACAPTSRYPCPDPPCPIPPRVHVPCPQPAVHRWFWWGDVLSGRAVALARGEAEGVAGWGGGDGWHEAEEGSMVGGQAWGDEESGAAVRERGEGGSGVSSGATGALLEVEEVGRRGVAMEGQEDRWSHGDVDTGQGEGRYGVRGVGGGVEDEGGEWDDGEEWMEEEWDEDEWESEEEEDDRDDSDEVSRCWEEGLFSSGVWRHWQGGTATRCPVTPPLSHCKAQAGAARPLQEACMQAV